MQASMPLWVNWHYELGLLKSYLSHNGESSGSTRNTMPAAWDREARESSSWSQSRPFWRLPDSDPRIYRRLVFFSEWKQVLELMSGRRLFSVSKLFVNICLLFWDMHG